MVNDLGSSLTGETEESSPAADVVAEIQATSLEYRRTLRRGQPAYSIGSVASADPAESHKEMILALEHFKVTMSRVGQRSTTQVEVDAPAPLAAAVMAFALVSDGTPEVVEVAPLRDASSSTLTVLVDAGPSGRFRIVVEPVARSEPGTASRPR